MSGRQASRLRQMRKRLGKTQADLAEDLGVTRITIGRWEAGAEDPPRLVRLALAALIYELAPWPVEKR